MHKRYLRNFINGKKSGIWTHTVHIKLIKTENNRFDKLFHGLRKNYQKTRRQTTTLKNFPWPFKLFPWLFQDFPDFGQKLTFFQVFLICGNPIVFLSFLLSGIYEKQSVSWSSSCWLLLSSLCFQRAVFRNQSNTLDGHLFSKKAHLRCLTGFWVRLCFHVPLDYLRVSPWHRNSVS